MWLPKEERKTLSSYYQKTDAGAREIKIELTPEGLRLGEKFNSIIRTIGTWCTEYMWFFVVLGVIIGTITLLITILKC